jgi:hypothetical protein
LGLTIQVRLVALATKLLYTEILLSTPRKPSREKEKPVQKDARAWLCLDMASGHGGHGKRSRRGCQKPLDNIELWERPSVLLRVYDA